MLALKESDLKKAPGPDGFNTGWIKIMWESLHSKILKFFDIFYNSGSIPAGANSSFIALIPKKPNAV